MLEKDIVKILQKIYVIIINSFKQKKKLKTGSEIYDVKQKNKEGLLLLTGVNL